VEQVFCEIFGPDIYGESCVDRVDIIVRQDRNTNEPFHVVFVHFSENMEPTEYVVDFSKRIIDDEEVKIQYDYPWFWKVRQNRNNKVQGTGPRIMSKRDEEALMNTQRTILRNRAAQRLDFQAAEEALSTPPPPLVMPSPPMTPPRPERNVEETMGSISPKSNNSSRKSWSELDAEDEE